MKQLIILVSVAIIFSVFFKAQAIADDEPIRPYEFWACSYNDGKNKSDLLAARDYAVAQASKAGITPPNTFLWTLAKGDRAIDFMWMRSHATYIDWARYNDTVGAKPQMAKVQQRFDEVATCYAGMGRIRTLYTGIPIGNPDGYLVSNRACRVKPGVKPEDLDDLEAHIARHRASLGEKASRMTAAIRPTSSGPNTPDWVVFDLYGSFSEMVASRQALEDNADSANLRRHMNMKLDCDPALWFGQRVMSSGG